MDNRSVGSRPSGLLDDRLAGAKQLLRRLRPRIGVRLAGFGLRFSGVNNA